MSPMIEALLKTENIALLVLAVGNIAQWKLSHDHRKEAREDRRADAQAVAEWMDKFAESMKTVERTLVLLAERVKGS